MRVRAWIREHGLEPGDLVFHDMIISGKNLGRYLYVYLGEKITSVGFIFYLFLSRDGTIIEADSFADVKEDWLTIASRLAEAPNEI